MSETADIDPYKFFQIIQNPDGTLTRNYQDPQAPTASDPTLPISVLTKDVILSQSNNTSIRIFLPRKALHNSFTDTKLPLIVYFHGGGFIVWRAASQSNHDFCVNIANHVHAVIASVDYRLAPEHRLPAAYDDAMEALQWIKTNQDEWLTQYADRSICYLMGSSAGGNIAYHAGLRVAAGVDQLENLRIRGLILHQPFFSGSQRSGSELRAAKDPMVPLSAIDLSWNLALPSGADRDHEYSNPRVGNGPRLWDKIRELGWRVLVTGCDGDPLIDRGVEVMKLLEEKGVKVVGHFETGNYHAFEIHDPSKARPFLEAIKYFIQT